MSLPRGLDVLFADGGADRELVVELPSGRLVEPEGGGRPRYWLSDEPVDAEVWSELRRAHPRSGLWPLLVDGLSGVPERPWSSGEVAEDPEAVDDIDRLSVESVLRRAWDEWSEEDLREEMAPFTATWPGLAPAGEVGSDPDDEADEVASVIDDGESPLLLVPARRGADALTTLGWQGPMNYSNDMVPLSAVLRSWEDRFGIRVAWMGFDTLAVTVAAPPTTADHALRVAAEHYAFCPDNVLQGPGKLAEYAEMIRSRKAWEFWWD